MDGHISQMCKTFLPDHKEQEDWSAVNNEHHSAVLLVSQGKNLNCTESLLKSSW